MSYTRSYKSMTRICGRGQCLSSHPYPAHTHFLITQTHFATCVCVARSKDSKTHQWSKWRWILLTQRIK